MPSNAGDSQPDPDVTIPEEGWLEPALPDTRRGARQLALQALYWESFAAGTAEEAIDKLNSRHSLSADNVEFATQLAVTVRAHSTQIDALINSSASHWRTDRIARLDGILLRLGLAEILYFEEIPVTVSIDEAVSLARQYCGEQAYAFVNGVLDAVAKNPAVANTIADDPATTADDQETTDP